VGSRMNRIEEYDENVRYIEVTGNIKKVTVNFGGIFIQDVEGHIEHITIEEIKEYMES
jgi:hypothetical protein